MRRLVDVLVALAALIVLLPVVILPLALLIRATIGSPVLFVQSRSGLHGTPFRLIKFRTMTDMRDASGLLLPDGRRVTRLGRLLRRTRVDELPEMLNILKGEMSLVGPRPLLPATVAALEHAGRRRGAIRPGLTGWAQVNGNALLSDTDKVALDLWYIDHRSLAIDLLIVLRTFRVLALGEQIDTRHLAAARDHARNRYRLG